MKEILKIMPVLSVAMLLNILLGTYYNIGLAALRFSWKVFFTGIGKAIIVAAAFLGLAYCFQATDLSSIGVTPQFVMNAAIILYAGKDLESLARIIGVHLQEKEE